MGLTVWHVRHLVLHVIQLTMHVVLAKMSFFYLMEHVFLHVLLDTLEIQQLKYVNSVFIPVKFVYKINACYVNLFLISTKDNVCWFVLMICLMNNQDIVLNV